LRLGKELAGEGVFQKITNDQGQCIVDVSWRSSVLFKLPSVSNSWRTVSSSCIHRLWWEVFRKLSALSVTPILLRMKLAPSSPKDGGGRDCRTGSYIWALSSIALLRWRGTMTTSNNFSLLVFVEAARSRFFSGVLLAAFVMLLFVTRAWTVLITSLLVDRSL
jgi:hypothetical protein